MRTTVDIPDDIRTLVDAVARDQRASLSDTVVDLVKRGLGVGQPPASRISRDEKTGLATITLGHPITQADVDAALDDTSDHAW